MSAGLSSLISLGRSPRFRAAKSPALALLLASPRVDYSLAPRAINRRAKSARALDCARRALTLARAAARLDRTGLSDALAALALEDLGRDDEAAAWYAKAALRAPREGWIHLARAEALRRTGNLEGFAREATAAHYLDEGAGAFRFAVAGPRGQTVRQALNGASAYLKKHPRSAWALALRGDLKRFPEIGDFPGAVADFKAALRLAPREAWIHAYLSRALISTGDPKGALDAVRRAVALRPDCGWIRAWEGEVLRRKGSTREAVSSLNRAIKIDANYEFAWAWRGGAHRMLGHLKEAERDLTRAAELDPTYAWTFVERQLVRRARGHMKEALDDLEAARRLDPKSEFCERPEEASRAVAQLTAWLAKHPKDDRARAWLGRTRLVSGDFEGARRDLARARARAWHGEALAMLGRHQEAELEFSAALKTQPDHAEVLAQRGQSRLALGRTAQALVDLRAAAQREPRAAWIHAAHSEAALAAGRKAEAAAAFRRARGLAPSDIEKRARRLIEAGRHEEAAALCTRALVFEPKGRELLAVRAEAYRCLHRHAEAVADHDRLVALSKRDPQALLSRGAARRAARDYAGALSDARAARRQRPVSALILEAEALRNLGREREASAAAARACALEPRRAWAWVVRAKAALQDGDRLAARGYCEQALRLDATDAKALGWRAWVNIRLGAPERARGDARLARALSPDTAWLLAAEAEASRALGDHESARRLMAEAVRLDPRCSCGYDIIGDEPSSVREDHFHAWVYAWSAASQRAAGGVAAARADFAHALELDPGCSWARAWSGETSLAEGRPAAALADLDAALKADPRHADAWAWRGRALTDLGRKDEAVKSYRSALKLEPDHVWALIGLGVCLGTSHYLERARKLAPGLFNK